MDFIINGVVRLLNDALNWIVVIAPLAAAATIGAYFIAKKFSDEMDTKKWNKRIIGTSVSVVGAISAKLLVSGFLAYFGG